jgi:dolichol-phosphate mannosyltransferase
MIEKWREGYQVVYGLRAKRKGESLFKKATAKLFYRSLNALTDVHLPVDAGDFRLIDRAVCDALKRLPERNRYVRGLVSWVGFKQTAVEYVREGRFAGTTKYPLRKMLGLAGDALTSFSYKPLKLSIFIGLLVSLFSFVYGVVIICQWFFTDAFVSGWATLACLTLFFNGLILVMMGVIGQYIGRIYDETKGRPLYIVAEKVNFDE